MKVIDEFLNFTTMYRLVLYYLVGLIAAALVFSFIGVLSIDPLNLLFSCVFLLFVSWVTNQMFSAVFKVPTNLESVYITSLILTLIVTPARSVADLGFLFWVAVWGSASKFIFNYRGKHFFNPAAFAVLLPSLVIEHSASWWVGTSSMVLPVILGGLLVLRKTQKEHVLAIFLLFAVGTIFILNFPKGSDPSLLMTKIFLDSPILFFAFVMLTEPITMPPRKYLQIIYAIIVGILFAPQLKIAGSYTTPESALIIGNIFSYLVSPKDRILLALRQRKPLTSDTADFIFEKKDKFQFRPGEYLEWTLGHEHQDSRGTRRIFTIASSPTEDSVRFGIKFYQPSSSFKQALLGLSFGSEIAMGQLAGDFLLPDDRDRKLVFIAGGIGITPFRSMLKYLIDTDQRRSIILIYSVKCVSDIVYKDVFEEAAKKLGVSIIYVLTDGNKVPSDWQGKVGFISADLVSSNISDYRERLFFISGPHSLVDSSINILKKMGVSEKNIKTDFFSGYA